jgi:hypothetical protein
MFFLKGEMGNDSDLLEHILEVADEEDVSRELLQQASSKKALQPLNKTRWTACVDSLSAIITNYSKIYESLIKIEDKSSGDAKSKASGHRRMLEDPEFIIAIVVAQYKRQIAIWLLHLMQAQNTLNTIKGLRTDEKFSELFTRAQIIADTMEVVLQPRTMVGRHLHRDNSNVNSPQQLWRTTMYFAFLDHVNNELERRFPGDQRQMMLGQYMIPSKFEHLVDSVVDELSTVFQA